MNSKTYLLIGFLCLIVGVYSLVSAVRNRKELEDKGIVYRQFIAGIGALFASMIFFLGC